ncbi:hypothetical protein V493_04488 [Pseudogymnoascus sp. VKM F-4281 (FW-2241)]|nr:hypothetical protein V493_04488 [Pseudogymnoascus sp. VKM F-4281 (FW-2241)]
MHVSLRLLGLEFLVRENRETLQRTGADLADLRSLGVVTLDASAEVEVVVVIVDVGGDGRLEEVGEGVCVRVGYVGAAVLAEAEDGGWPGVPAEEAVRPALDSSGTLAALAEASPRPLIGPPLPQCGCRRAPARTPASTPPRDPSSEHHRAAALSRR